MSEEVKIKQEGAPVVRVDVSPNDDVIDLTLSDSDEDIANGKDEADNAPSPTPVAQDSPARGDYRALGLYATSLRERSSLGPRKRYAEEGEEEKEGRGVPIVTPRKRRSTVGAIGHSFHRRFIVDGKEVTFHGTVVEILTKAKAGECVSHRIVIEPDFSPCQCCMYLEHGTWVL